MGIKARLIPLPVDELMRRYVQNTEFQAVLTEISCHSGLPQRLREHWTPLGSGKSLIGCFEHPDLTRILAEAQRESQPERARELYEEAEALIVSLQPGTLLFHRKTLDVISRRIDFPHPFSFLSWDIHRLRSASVRNLKASGK